MLFKETGKVQRTRRREILYTDKELMPWFDEIAKGYCYKQACKRAGLDHDKLHDTMYSDDEVMWHMLDLSTYAGALIRSGKLEVPDRWDGLYDEYK